MIINSIPIVAAIVLLGYIAYQRILSPLSSIPGPFNASLSKWWLVRHTWRGDFHRQILRLHSIHGPLVRTGPNEVSIADPVALKRIYGEPVYHHLVGSSNNTSEGAGSKFKKAKWYDTLQGGRQFDLFGEQDIAVHTSQRRLVSRVYAMETLKDLEPYVEATVTRLVEILRELLAGSQKVDVDMGVWLQLFAFGISPLHLGLKIVNTSRCYW